MDSKIKMVEQARNTGSFHLASEEHYPLLSLCGKSTIIPPMNVEWGIISSEVKNFCKRCEELAKQNQEKES